MNRIAPPPLNALRAFEAFARHASMSRAAEELCVTHGAVSRQVRVLQEHLGTELVRGPRHRLELTPAGAELATRLSSAFGTIADAVKAARAGAHREIEISCLGTFALKWLIPRLPGFLAAHPEVRVRMSESYAPVDFARDRFDAAIRVLEPGPTPRTQVVTVLMPLSHGPVVAAGVAADCASLDVLLRQPRLFAASFRESWRDWSERSGHALPPAAIEREFAHNHAMIEAAASGLGAAIAPWAFVAPDIASGRLVAPFGFSERASRFVFIRPASRPDLAVDAFRDWLVAEGATTPIPWTGPDD